MKDKNNNQRVSLFKNLHSPQSCDIRLEELVRLVVHDSDVAYKTETYRKMEYVLGKQKADCEVKQKLMPAVSVAVLFDGNGRQSAHVMAFTGLALVDIDHVGDIGEAFARVKADPHTLLAYRTISGKGLRIIYRYERSRSAERINATSWRAAFLKGNGYFARLTGCDYDTQCSEWSCKTRHSEWRAMRSSSFAHTCASRS